jgi:hypothetical protein
VEPFNIVQVAPDRWMANMIERQGIKRSSTDVAIRYEAVSKCLTHLAVAAHSLEASIYMPRIGCGWLAVRGNALNR